MFVRVVAKLSKTISRRELNKQLKELNNLTVNVGTNVKAEKDTREKLQKNIKMLQQSISDLEIGLNTSKINSDVQSVRNNVQKKINRTPIDLNLQIKKEKAISDIEYIAKRYSKLFSNTSASQKFENILNSAYSISDSKDLSKVRAQISAFTSELKSNGLAAQSTGDKWRKLLDRSKELFSAASVIRTIFVQARQAVSATIGLDKVYTDLIKVNSELNRNDYSEYLSKCNKKAQELATTQKALIEGATEFSKSGYDLHTSDKLTEKSTVLANVGEMSASDSAKAIISGVQAYDEVDGYTDVSDKAQALIDKYNEVGNTASITTAEIAQGIQKVGSVFSDANTSADEFISLLAAGNRQYQDADTLALGLRTSALRIRGCTAELEEMGEETEGVCTSASKLEEKIKGLTNVNGSGGVEILETDKETFRSIYDIYVDIGKVYKDMSDTDQSALLELIAGKHRASAISATLNNMTEAETILQNSLNAAGSAQKEYDAYLESTEAHIQQFQAKLVETYSTFLNGDMISHVADLGTGILDLVNKTDLLKHTLIAIATIKIGQGISAIGGVIANTTKQMKTLGDALQQVKNLPLDGALRKSSLEQLGESTKSLTEKNLKLLLSQEQLSNNDKIRILRMHDLTKEQAKEKLEKLGLTNATNANTAANAANATSVKGLKGAFVGLTASVKATWAAMSTLQKASIIFAAISTAWSVLSSVVSSHNESVEEAKEKTKELAEKAMEEEKSLVSLIKQYNELDKTDRSPENTEKIRNLNEQINSVLGDQADQLDLVNGKLDEQGEKIKQNLLQKLKDDKSQLDTAASIAKADYDAGLDEGMFGIDTWGSVSRALTENGATGIGNIGFHNVSDILRNMNTDQQIEQIKAWLDFLTGVDAGSGKYGDQLASLQAWHKELIEKRDKYNEAKEAQEANEARQKILNDSASGKINDFSAFKNYRNELQKTYNDNSVFRDQMLDFIDNIYPEYAQQVRDTAKEVQDSATNSSPISFSKAWSELKESDQNALKKETLEGILDKDSISEFQDLSDNFSLQQIRDEILSLIPLDDKLSQFIDDSEKLTAAYSEMKKNKTVSTKTLLGMPEGIRRLKGYTDFRNTVSDAKVSRETKKDAFEDIITEYLKANQTIMDSSEETRNFVVDALKDAGIINAETLVDGVINCKDTITEVMSEIDKANDTDVKNFARACSAKNLNNTKLYNSIGQNTAYMLNQLKDKYADDVMNFGKALQEKLKAEKKYAAAILEMEGIANGGTSNAAMASFFGTSGGAMSPSSDPEAYKKYKDAKQRLDKANKDYKKLLAKLRKNLEKVNIAKIDYDPTTKDGSSKKKDKAKKTKTEIDWISRLIERTTTKIDIFKAKLQNLFTVKAKNSNLNKQLKQTTKLINAYGTAVKKYTKKANSVKFSSGLKGLKKQIREGKIKGKPKDLIKKYGEKTANKIQAYQNWYDKAQDAKKNKAAQITAKRELTQQKLQNYVDLYDSRTARAEAKESIQTNAKDKNKAIDTQIKNVNKSYAKQIKIARELTKNKAEADRLEYEQQLKIRELKQKGLQYYVDEYNASADLSEINSSNAIGYEKQNGFIRTQLSYLQKSYAKQIEIAKLTNDKTEQERLQAEYEAKKVDLQKQQIDNIKAEYENKISHINNGKQNISNSLSETEARGNIVQAAFYSSLNSYEEQVLAKLNEERGELLAQQNTFTQYSQEWYDLQSDIQSVENSISETNISIIENNKKIGELRQAMYDDIASRNSDASSEAQFLAGLLGGHLTDDKTGKLTKEGLGVLGTYGIELEANTNTAGVFKQEREEIEKAIAAFYSGDTHALDLYGSLTAAKKELNEIIKKQQEATASEYDAKKKIYDIMVQMYDTQLAYMRSIIDAKKQVLDMEKDLYDYERNINSQTKNIASMEKQLASLKGDDSEEGRARRAKLQSALDEANQNLQDTEYERYISDQQNMLDNMYTQYEDLLTALEKDFETVVKDGITTINKTAGGISQTLNDIAEKYDYVTSKDMSSIMNSFKDTGLTKLESIFGSLANEIRNAYNNGTGGSNGGNGLSGQRGGNTDTNPPGGTPNRDTVIQQGKIDAENAETQKNDLKKILAKADYAKKAAKSPEKYKSRLNQILAKETGYVVTISDGYTASKFLQALNGNGCGSAKPGKDGSYYAKDGNIYKKLQEKFPLIGFRTGGIVRASGVPKDGDHVPVRVNPDETILTKEFTEMLPETVETMKGLSRTEEKGNTKQPFVGNVKLFPDQIKDVAAFINRPDHTSELTANGRFGTSIDKVKEIESFIKNMDQTRNMQPNHVGNNFGDIVINANLPNVDDGHSFVSEVQNEIRSRRFFETCVYDCMTKGKITHNIQRF